MSNIPRPIKAADIRVVKVIQERWKIPVTYYRVEIPHPSGVAVLACRIGWWRSPRRADIECGDVRRLMVEIGAAVW